MSAIPQAVEQWLIEHGVPQTAITDAPALGYAHVQFDKGTASLAPLGDQSEKTIGAIMLPCHDRDHIVDWVAWAPRTKRLGLMCNIGFCIGDLDHVFNPATYFAHGALVIHDTPLAWLKDGRKGIVIVARNLTHAYLGLVQRVQVANPELAKKIKRWVQPPKRSPRILVEKGAHAETQR